MSDLNRRSALGLGVAAAAVVSAPTRAADRTDDRPLTRIAFGSCANQDKDQPIWDAVLAARPDLFIFLGDNIYADTRDPAVMAAKYAKLAAKPGFQRLKASVPLMAIWDDHDYGENDAGGEYPMKEESRRQFCDFWGEAATSPRRTREGVHTAAIFGPAGRRVQIILPDLRWNRTPLEKIDLAGADYKAWATAKADKGAPVPGPYARNPDQAATMIGEAQWRWLEEELARPVDLRILGSSLQVLADFAGWESWVNYARDHQRLFETIRRTRAEGLFCISGDTHYGEISRLDVNTPYPLWDITSSGLTEVWPVTPPNALRQGQVLREQNFGLIEIDWRPARPTARIEVRDVTGAPRLSTVIDTAALRIR
ncbi:alkaline phosphatase D family protein [Caulobacter sp. NIBR2454]|uniref:alkaline phosphatase D family protein n=1 Tax=Caulobacter sp. NIBR2454 TaxID=3015996 RepID=UPI0022B702F9|nr:alkaline phosphatase D family protein [Caulobacter sp. NIBR2454]